VRKGKGRRRSTQPCAAGGLARARSLSPLEGPAAFLTPKEPLKEERDRGSQQKKEKKRGKRRSKRAKTTGRKKKRPTASSPSLHSISEGSLTLRTLPLSLNSNRRPPLPGCRSLKRREHGKARRDRGATGAGIERLNSRVSVLIHPFVFFSFGASKSRRVPVRLASPFPRAMQPTVQDNSSHIDRAHRGGSEGGQSCRLRGGASHEMMRGRFSLGRAQVLFLKNDIFLASAGAFFERESHLFPQPEAAVRHALCVPGVRTGRAKTRTLRKKGKTFGGGEKHESIFSPLLRSRTCSHLL